MDAREKILERLGRLIAKGEEIAPGTDLFSFGIGGIEADAAGWRAQAGTLLIDLCGANSMYTQHFWHLTKEYDSIEAIGTGVAILRTVREEIENGYMQTYRQRISAEFVGDLIEQAEHLHENGFHQAATSIAGAALESGLREVATNNGITLRGREDLNALSDKLKNGNVISELERKQISFLIGARNAADHAEFDDVSPDDVTRMIRDARDFLAKHAT